MHKATWTVIWFFVWKMTAPGLDAFVSWVEEHTKNNENNIAKLRDFLKVIMKHILLELIQY